MRLERESVLENLRRSLTVLGMAWDRYRIPGLDESRRILSQGIYETRTRVCVMGMVWNRYRIPGLVEFGGILNQGILRLKRESVESLVWMNRARF